MQDSEIIELYFKRSEYAIAETSAKYGKLCYGIAFNILSSDADALECLNDAYLQAWNNIPPKYPDNLGAWLGRVVRNIAINLWNKNHSKKRYVGVERLLDELQDSIPTKKDLEYVIEEKELTALLNSWLSQLPKSDRILFVRRYWYGEALKNLANEYGVAPQRLAKRMFSLRQSLKSTLEREGYLL